MRIKGIWIFAVALVLISITGVFSASCSSQSNAGEALTPTATTSPKVAQNLILESDIVTGSGGTVKAPLSCILSYIT